MPWFKSQTQSLLLLDRIPGTNTNYKCEGLGRKNRKGEPLNMVYIEEDHLSLPGIHRAIKEEKILVPCDRDAELKKAKEALEVKKSDSKKSEPKKTEPPVPDLTAGVSGGKSESTESVKTAAPKAAKKETKK